MMLIAWNARLERRAAAALALVCSVATMACSPFDGTRPPRADAGVSGAPGAAGTECTLRRPPERPPPDDAAAGKADEPTITLVGRNFELGDGTDENGRPSYGTLGFDLDGECTEQGDGHACTAADWAAADLRILDGDNGIDNAIGAAFAFFTRSGSPSPTAATNQRVADGEYSYMLRIDGYNGLADDAKVSVAWTDVVLAKPAGAAASRPTWQGTDEWLGVHHFFELEREPEEYGADDLPAFKYVDAEAYVAGHRLVVRLPRLYGGLGMYSDFQVSAPLIRDAELGWRIDGAIGSTRVDLDAMLMLIGVSLGPKDGSISATEITLTPVCLDHPLYAERKRLVCSSADVSYDGPDARSSLCDGTSWGWRFDAAPAKLVGIREHDVPSTCPAGRVPGIDDHCGSSLSDGGAP